MEIADPVSSILNQKGSTEIYSVVAEDTVFDAIQLMAEKNIGAALVIEDAQLIGIVSERDYTRKVILEGRASRDTPVGDIMSSPVVAVPPNTSVGTCLQLMTRRYIRHLPVLAEEGSRTVIGVVSIGDLVKRTIAAQEAMIDQLESYLAGGYPG